MSKIAVRNPRTGKIDFEFSRPTVAEINHLCAGLRDVQVAWWQKGVEHRVKALLAFANELDEHRDTVIGALCADTGRWALTVMEVDGLVGYTRARCSHAEAVLKEASGESSRGDVRFWQQYVPYRLLGVISPWNYP